MQEPTTEKKQQEKKKKEESPNISLKGVYPWMLDSAEALEKFGSDGDKGLAKTRRRNAWKRTEPTVLEPKSAVRSWTF